MTGLTTDRAEHVSRTTTLCFKDGAVGIRDTESAETYWLPWCLFQNVCAVMREPYIEGHYGYDIMAEFHALEVGWEVEGFSSFLDAMQANLEGFDIELARIAINGLTRENPLATIYSSPDYPEETTTRGIDGA